MSIVVLHAYSRTNSGDGLLVDLTVRRLSRIFPEDRIVIVAQDPGSFPEYEVRSWSAARSLLAPSSRWSTVQVSLTGPARHLLSELDAARLIVGVGGGYLRASSVLELAKSFFAHYSQLKAATSANAPAVYLPQSIGPYPKYLSRIVLNRVGRLQAFHVRDDRSLEFLAGAQNVKRTPDLAVLELFENEIGTIDGPFGRPVAIAREIDRPGTYYDTLRDMSDTGRFDWAVQASARGNNDVPLSQRLAGGCAKPVSEVLNGDQCRVVVSTRLHGALEAILRGYPAVHLGYERKSWGAFEDLGLGEFVLDCRRTSGAEVAKVVDRIENDPDTYWSRVRSAQESMSEASGQLDSMLLSASVEAGS
ncbi:polysaccharide pyruvyl transferase family protein [Gordonia sp. NPDC058843]|uniref:polysaccharide pyruvyl transferase family protein n=1 Tax=Gordonia sp. NPDC058843 TaxID=3346648 RepID=UPI0036993FC7